MSDNIPFEIQTEIIKRVPDVKSLIQFRSVSKSWKSLIDSPKFIADYHTSRHNHRLLAMYNSPESIIDNYALFVDDDSFPQHKIPMTLPMSVSKTTLVTQFVTTSTSQGLVCFFIYDKNHFDTATRTAVLWNPAIRKSVDIVVPILLNSKTTFIGFGVLPHTNDPMLVKITYISNVNSDCIPWHVEVFTLSTGVWRSLCTHLPRKFIQFSWDHVAIDRFIYWMGVDVDDDGRLRNMIMSFDMTREVFKEISLPDCLTYFHPKMLDIFKLKESLVVLKTDEETEIQEVVVWIMEHDVPNSFRKLYTIKASDASIEKVLGFRSCGESVVDRSFNFGGQCVWYATSVYDPCSQCFNDIVIYDTGCHWLHSVSSYTETLLLLDR